MATVVVNEGAFDMMTIRRLSIGAGYKYLLKSIAVGDGPEALPRESFSEPDSSVSTMVLALPPGSP